jgi:hypothetical protein
MSLTRIVRVSLVLVAVPALVHAAGSRELLSRARQLYNASQYDASIDAAAEAARVAEYTDAATLVMARAYIERFRRDGNAADLSTAREALKKVRTAGLPAADRPELAIALGEVLFFDDEAGAAAEQFEIAMARPDPKHPERHLRMLDWWATALDRQAHLSSPTEARDHYARIITRMEEELRRDGISPIASYWLVVASRGRGDLTRAWDAAIAAWVRAPHDEGGKRLRDDLDRFVGQVVIPERARDLNAASPQSAAAGLRADWERLKQAWTNQ